MGVVWSVQHASGQHGSGGARGPGQHQHPQHTHLSRSQEACRGAQRRGERAAQSRLEREESGLGGE
eukprot:2077974-Rhodomonas_salina.1